MQILAKPSEKVNRVESNRFPGGWVICFAQKGDAVEEKESGQVQKRTGGVDGEGGDENGGEKDGGGGADGEGVEEPSDEWLDEGMGVDQVDAEGCRRGKV